jgi:hypothetical protein
MAKRHSLQYSSRSQVKTHNSAPPDQEQLTSTNNAHTLGAISLALRGNDIDKQTS